MILPMPAPFGERFGSIAPIQLLIFLIVNNFFNIKIFRCYLQKRDNLRTLSKYSNLHVIVHESMQKDLIMTFFVIRNSFLNARICL